MRWDDIHNGDRVEIALLQVDIAGHSKLQANDRALQKAKSIFRDQMEGIARSRNGRLFSWAGDGGAFMFLTGAGQDGFDDLAFSALQMLGNMPAINQETAIRTDLNSPLNVRISADVGTAAYDTDPSKITADFINRFLKNERTLGLTNTVSITDRVWRQISRKLQERFVPFKTSHEVEATIYNHGGKEIQSEVLRSLQNVDHSGPIERPPSEAAYAEIVAFQGDTLADLSTKAYDDVTVKGFDNVGGINLLMIKNSLLCQEHVEQVREGDDDLNFEEMSAEQRRLLARLLEKLSCEDRDEVVNRLRRLPMVERKHLIEHLREDPEFVRHILETLMGPDFFRPKYGRDLFERFTGGESVRFYNTTALGFVPEIGDGTLLDHVFAGNLQIKKVVGGVSEPVVKKRLYKSQNGKYVELEVTSSDDKDVDSEENSE